MKDTKAWCDHQPFEPATNNSYCTHTSPPFIMCWLFLDNLTLQDEGCTFLQNTEIYWPSNKVSHHRQFVLALFICKRLNFFKIWTAMETKYKDFNVTIMFQFTKICNNSKSEIGVACGLSSFLVLMTLRNNRGISCSEIQHSWGGGGRIRTFWKDFSTICTRWATFPINYTIPNGQFHYTNM